MVDAVLRSSIGQILRTSRISGFAWSKSGKY